MKEVLYAIEKADIPPHLIDYVYHLDNITLNIMAYQS